MNYQGFFDSKESAGKIIAEYLEKEGITKPFLLAVPRGGIQVAEAIAEKFHTPINAIISKKLPLPINPEVAFGAMTEDEIDILNVEMMHAYDISDDDLKIIANKVNQEIKHRIKTYGRFNPENVQGAQAVIIDDGVATGSSLIAAIKKVKTMNPKELIVAVGASTNNAYQKISPMVDKFISPIIDDSPFFAVSQYYKHWKDLSEEEILEVLKKYRKSFS